MVSEDLFDATQSNPWAFFDTAAGPDTTDIYGPPMNVLDTFLDGSPVAMSEQYLQNQTPGVGSGSFSLSGLFGRADVRAFITLGLGLAMLHLHMNS